MAHVALVMQVPSEYPDHTSVLGHSWEAAITAVEPAPSADEMTLLAVIGRMRGQGRFALSQFLSAFEHDMACGLVITSTPKGIVECTYLVAGCAVTATMKEL